MMATGKEERIKTVKRTLHEGRKTSRKRLDQVNAAAKRCRQRQKEELLFLRNRVKELESRMSELHVDKPTDNNLKENDKLIDKLSDDGWLTKSSSPSTVDLMDDDENDEDFSSLISILSNLPDRSNNFHMVSGNLSPTGRIEPVEHHDSIISLMKYLQAEAFAAKEHIQTHFVHSSVLERDGYAIRTILSPYYSSTYITKFFPFVQAESIRKAFQLLGDSPCLPNMISREEHYITDSILIIDALKICDYALMAYGRAELECKIVISVWKEESDDLLVLCTPFGRGQSRGRENTVKWNYNGWIHFRESVENGVPGVFFRRFTNTSYDNGADSNPRVGPGVFAEHQLHSLLLQLRDFENCLGLVCQSQCNNPPQTTESCKIFP